MIIKFGVGIDSILFGLTQQETIAILGNPDKINSTERDDSIIFYYNAEMMKLIYSIQDDNRLFSIEVFHPEVYLYNKKAIGFTKAEIEILLEQNSITSIVYDDYDTFDTIFCEEIWATFEFEFNKLRSVEFSILIGDHDTLIWPQINL